MTFASLNRSSRTPAQDDPRPVFRAMFDAARAYLLGDGQSVGAHGAVATNPKGEMTRAFDANAERIALDVAREYLGAFRLLSEEAGALTVGKSPRWTLVLDPCDGSNNFKRGIRSVGFAVAALPADAPLDPDLVEYAFCGDIFTGSAYVAARGQGTLLDGRPIHCSPVTELRYTTLGVNLGRARTPETQTPDPESGRPMAELVWRLVTNASTIRRVGATVLDLCYVAQGAYDAYVDLRTRLTPENFMAPALVLREAGGLLTGPRGEPLGEVEFTRPYSVLAAANPTLLGALLETLYAAG
ncbi:MAG TPA: inositol monophosphatase family protein [Ktedonobacterales bacterium]|nr:inositol monophosphatase family protein [Ktedonobacterales bacterium]